MSLTQYLQSLRETLKKPPEPKRGPLNLGVPEDELNNDILDLRKQGHSDKDIHDIIDETPEIADKTGAKRLLLKPNQSHYIKSLRNTMSGVKPELNLGIPTKDFHNEALEMAKNGYTREEIEKAVDLNPVIMDKVKAKESLVSILGRAVDPEQYKALGQLFTKGTEEISQLPGIKQAREFLAPDKEGMSEGEVFREQGLIKVGNAYVDPLGMGSLRNVAGKATKAVAKPVSKVAGEAFTGLKDLTLKTLEKLKGRDKVSKQFIQDLTNAPDLKQAERDLLRRTLEDYKGDVPVQEFANKIKTELLPLTTKSTLTEKISRKQALKELKNKGIEIEQEMDGGASLIDRKGEALEYDDLPDDIRKLVDTAIGDAETYEGIVSGSVRYESVTLPNELRGPVANYYENIYQSPIKTSAGKVHFGSEPNYFAHSRIEDLPHSSYKAGEFAPAPGTKGETRRVIEIQSDLFQKGRLEGEAIPDVGKIKGSTLENALLESDKPIIQRIDELKRRGFSESEISKLKRLDENREAIKAKLLAPGKERIAPLEPYRNTWHERVIKEEIKQAAKDGKTKLQFPTGETALKIEGLGSNNPWMAVENGRTLNTSLTSGELKIGKEINDGGSDWIITDVLGDGKFKAMPKEHFDSFAESKGVTNLSGEDLINYAEQHGTKNFWGSKESFDISGKVDTNNPIYKFYEKDVQKFLTNKYGAKRITDAQGVEWVEINIDPKMKGLPIEAFGVLPAIPLLQDKNDKK